MRMRPLKAKTRGRLLASGLFLVTLSTAASLTTPSTEPVNAERERTTLSASAKAAQQCDRAG
ncbi:MAG: hypothetical protein AAGH19_05560 [Pseudomonadota bacterium]